MATGVAVGVVGATGAAGSTTLRILEERKFPVRELRCFASPRSVGTTVRFAGEPVPIRRVEASEFRGLDIVFCSAGTAQAQSPTGTILGHVKDTTGAVVPAATVTATHLGTQYARTTTTDAEGQYAPRLLPVGQYKVDISLTGFKSFSQTGILLEVGRNARVDATLETGGVEEVVSVTADATLVETSVSSLSRTVGQNEDGRYSRVPLVLNARQ